MPADRRDRYKSTMAAMEVGDSFVCPGYTRRQDDSMRPSRMVHEHARSFGYTIGVRLESRDPLTVRVWRLT